MTFKDPLLTNEWALEIGKDKDRTIDASGSLIEGQDIFTGNQKTATKEGKRRAKLHFKTTRPTKLPFYLVYNTSGRLAICIFSKKEQLR